MKRCAVINPNVIYELSCTTANSTIRAYVRLVFRKFSNPASKKLEYPDFQKWVQRHPSMLKSFERHHFFYIWGVVSSSSEKPHYKSGRPEFSSIVTLYQNKGGSKRASLEIYSKFMLLYTNRENDLPTSMLR